MFDIEKFKKEILGKYKLSGRDCFNYLLFTNFWKNGIDLKINDISFDGLDELNSSNSIELMTNMQKAIITKSNSQDSPKYHFTFKIINFENKREFVNYIIYFTTDSSYSSLYTVYTVNIIEYDYEGGIYFTDIRKGKSSYSGMIASISYYNAETVEIFKSKSEDINIYEKLKTLKIMPDKYVEKEIGEYGNEEKVIENINTLREEIDKKDKAITLTNIQ